MICLALASLAASSFGLQIQPDRRLYVVGTAHLDTQWLWTIQNTINEYIPDTLNVNLSAFQKYPEYVFSFEGSFRYQLIKEYYPERWDELVQRVKEGRWRVTGSWIDAVDTNVPSTESLIRHALYANGFYRREFGKSSVDIFLPDCFGFGYALPSIGVHCGLKGFSTQKLTWGSAHGIPFTIGRWEGVDGNSLIAALDAGGYTGDVGNDWGHARWLIDRMDRIGKESGAYVDYRYHGAGDRGGGPSARSLANLDKAMKENGPIRVLSAGADQLFRDLNPAQVAKLPHYKGELVMTTHGTGCYTAQTAMKRWNKKNEMLADAAERAAVVANVLTGEPYPSKKLEEAWTRFLWHQFHDDLTGTSIPEAYQFSWNDELISLNQFGDILTRSISLWASQMDTRGSSLPIVVYNPHGRELTSLVEAWIPGKAKPTAMRSPEGKAVPADILEVGPAGYRIVFQATVPAVGLAVYHVDSTVLKPASKASKANELENDRLKVRVDSNGDVVSVFDKKLGKETLKAPIRLQLLENVSRDWSAWEIKYDAVRKAPVAYVGAKGGLRKSFMGANKQTIEAKDTVEGSKFVKRISLASGSSNKLEFEVDVDWASKGRLLKAAFPINVEKPKATYDLGLGTIERGVNKENLYEVPAQEWADLSDGSGSQGAAVLAECKYGWDRPDENTLRLTLIHTGDGRGSWDFQDSNDFGRQTMKFVYMPHEKDWRNGVRQEAALLNQPFRAFATSAHAGRLGKSYGFASVNSPNVSLRALKISEDGRNLVARLYEDSGKGSSGVRLSLSSALGRAQSLLGDETPANGPSIAKKGNSVTVNLKPYQPVTIGLEMPIVKRKPLDLGIPVVLPLDANCTSSPINSARREVPSQLWIPTIQSYGLEFRMGEASKATHMVCNGQKIPLPKNKANRLSLIVSAYDRDALTSVKIDGKPQAFMAPAMTGWHGQWWSRLATGRFSHDPQKLGKPFWKQAPLAHVFTHINKPDGTFDAYKFAYLYRIDIPVKPGSKLLELPIDRRVMVFAATLWSEEAPATPATPLFD